jgi:hypothetical protein
MDLPRLGRCRLLLGLKRGNHLLLHLCLMFLVIRDPRIPERNAVRTETVVVCELPRADRRDAWLAQGLGLDSCA